MKKIVFIAALFAAGCSHPKTPLVATLPPDIRETVLDADIGTCVSLNNGKMDKPWQGQITRQIGKQKETIKCLDMYTIIKEAMKENESNLQ